MQDAIANTLTPDERVSLVDHEATIEWGKRTFLEVGEALAAIRDGRLYRETHASFEAYLAERWDMGKAYAYRHIKAAEVAADLSPIGDTPAPASEAQVRELAKAAPEDRDEVWQQAVARAGGEAPPARLVAEVIAERAEPVVDDREAERYRSFNTAFSKKEAPPPLPAPDPKAVRDGDEWWTPSEYVEPARTVMGAIDLDPASCALANETVKAATYFDKSHDGLAMTWRGRVFLNPPYSETGAWIAKAIAEYAAGNIEQAIVLVNAKTETAWFNDLLDLAGVVCLVRSRIAFVPGDGGDSQTGRTGSAIFYLGPDVDDFCRVFGQFGRLVCDRPAPLAVEVAA